MLDQLSRGERLRLMKFVCSFAWADLQIQPEERAFVERLVSRLELDADEAQQVQGWLKLPPPPESVDPTDVPVSHRKIFVEAIEGVIASDGHVAPEEQEGLELFQSLLS